MDSETDRETDGTYRDRYDKEEFIRAVYAHQPASTKEIADEVGCVRQSADYRLRQLDEAGRVQKKMVGNSLVWSSVERDQPTQSIETVETKLVLDASAAIEEAERFQERIESVNQSLREMAELVDETGVDLEDTNGRR